MKLAGKIMITYFLYGGINSILNPVVVEPGERIILQEPYREGYNFKGWYIEDKAVYVDEITPTKDLCLSAKWSLEIDAYDNVLQYPYLERFDAIALKDIKFSFLTNIHTPGNPKTNHADYYKSIISSKNQCPQGICIVKDYFMISSYHTEKTELGSIMMLDKHTGQHFISLGMPKESHLGGIASDGKNLWICHSDTCEIECIAMGDIEHLMKVSNQSFVDISNQFKRYKINQKPSCITCYGNQVLIATFEKNKKGKMIAYELEFNENRLVPKKVYYVPAQTQGIALDENGACFITTSYGRNKSSYLWKYQHLDELSSYFKKEEYKIELPPGAEGIAYNNKNLYIVFETAASKYYNGEDGLGICKYPIDQILQIKLP